MKIKEKLLGVKENCFNLEIMSQVATITGTCELRYKNISLTKRIQIEILPSIIILSISFLIISPLSLHGFLDKQLNLTKNTIRTKSEPNSVKSNVFQIVTKPFKQNFLHKNKLTNR